MLKSSSTARCFTARILRRSTNVLKAIKDGRVRLEDVLQGMSA